MQLQESKQLVGSFAHIGQAARAGLRDLLPSYFALVMATGIVSIAASLSRMNRIAEGLFVLNWCFYIVLTIVFVSRFILYRQSFLADLSDHARGGGFFTVIAGTCVLGAQCVVLRQAFDVARFLLGVAFVLWLVLIYAFFAAITVRRNKPTLENGINGIWLVSVVATQAISILGTLLSGQFGESREAVLFCTLSLYFVGGFLYCLIITLVFYRLTFSELVAEQFAPPYWINMGALAITTLASSHLVMMSSHWSFLQEITPFLKAATVLAWAAGTWWIPLIILLGAWRHVRGQLPLTYHPQYWGMVFPLGMYTVATYRMIEALKISFLEVVPAVFVYVALGAWALTFGGLLWKIGQLRVPAASRDRFGYAVSRRGGGSLP